MVAVCRGARYQLCNKTGKEKECTQHHSCKRQVEARLVGEAITGAFCKALDNEVYSDDKTNNKCERTQRAKEMHGLFAKPAHKLYRQQIEETIDKAIPPEF